MTVAVARAPATVANVAVGFDILGHSLAGPHDRVTARRSAAPGVRIVAIRGSRVALPLDPERNTAGRAVLELLAAQQPGFGVELEIDKGIPAGSGLGSSAASAVAAVVAANALLEEPLPARALYPFALVGEAVASGSVHGDNVAPALLGGLVLATDLVLETRRARAALAAPYPLGDFVQQSANLALVLCGCFRGDLELIAAGLRDVLVEPRRAPLVPGLAAVQAAARAHGALGSSISGAGPAVFAWFAEPVGAARAGAAMQAAFATVGLPSEVHVAPVAGPAASVEGGR
jgi:homoserine kinase